MPLDTVQLARLDLPRRIWLAFLASDGSLIAVPVQAFSGRLDVRQITDDTAI